MQNETIGERIKNFIDLQNVKNEDFANKLCIKKEYLSQLIHNKRRAGTEIFLKFKAAYPNINLDWLTTGAGKPLLLGNNSEFLGDCIAHKI